jgi:hypothetical protein
VDGAEALASLGLRPGAAWPEIKAAYRRLIRSHHPDVATAPEDDTATTIIEAYTILGELNRSNKLPAPEAATTTAPGDRAVLVVARGALFENVCDAAHDIGDVTYIDPLEQTVQLLVRLPGWAPAQLTCEVARRHDEDVIISTLDSLDSRPAPPIEAVVKLLTSRLRSR